MPPIVRIDDRLIHGQVVEGWIVPLRIEEVLVASDGAAADPVQNMLMSLALPASVKLEILSVSRAAEHSVFGADSGRKAMVLVANPKDAWRLLENGARFDKLNLGGIHAVAGKVQLGRAVFLSEEDEDFLARINRAGISISVRPLPGDHEVDPSQAIPGWKAERKVKSPNPE